MLKFTILRDGWIKIAADDFRVGLPLNGKKSQMLIGLNQLLVQRDGMNILIDTGLGDRWRKGEIGLIDFETPRQMLRQMAQLAVRPEDIDIVVYTHLHYDHIGGGVTKLADRNLAPTFTKAVYYVQEAELDFALSPNANPEDYHIEDIQPLLETGRLQTVDGVCEIAPDIKLYPAPGHTPGHQVVVAEGNDDTIFFSGDLISTRLHFNLDITMIYDHNVQVLLEQRRKWMETARDWIWVLCHEMRQPMIMGNKLIG